jgi:glycosyltransferase involved in cell wall biosynthesis
MRRIDVIVAVRDEELTLHGFVDSIRSLALPSDVQVGFVFVEDSSTDATRDVLRALAEHDPTVSYYCLARGYGQGPAIVFGLARSRADAMIMLDVDGSHPVDVIPEMIRQYIAGAAVVQCKRRELTGRRAHRRLGTAAYHLLARFFTGRDPTEQAIYYRLVSAKVSARILAAPRTWHYLRFPLSQFAAGHSVDVINVNMRERTLGRSKYGILRLFDLALLGILTQLSVPRLAALCGGCLLVSGLLVRLGWPAFAAALLIVPIMMVARYAALGRTDVLSRMEVVQSSAG